MPSKKATGPKNRSLSGPAKEKSAVSTAASNSLDSKGQPVSPALGSKSRPLSGPSEVKLASRKKDSASQKPKPPSPSRDRSLSGPADDKPAACAAPSVKDPERRAKEVTPAKSFADAVKGTSHCRVVIHGVPADKDPTSLVSSLNTVGSGKKALAAMRLGGKGTFVVATEGDTAPACLNGDFGKRKATVFVEKPPICFRCSAPGHKSFQCRAEKQRCPVCSGDHRLKECQKRSNPLCPLCKEDHAAFIGQCPKLSRLEEVKKAAISYGSSFVEAERNQRKNETVILTDSLIEKIFNKMAPKIEELVRRIIGEELPTQDTPPAEEPKPTEQEEQPKETTFTVEMTGVPSGIHMQATEDIPMEHIAHDGMSSYYKTTKTSIFKLDGGKSIRKTRKSNIERKKRRCFVLDLPFRTEQEKGELLEYLAEANSPLGFRDASADSKRRETTLTIAGLEETPVDSIETPRGVRKLWDVPH